MCTCPVLTESSRGILMKSLQTSKEGRATSLEADIKCPVLIERFYLHMHVSIKY